MRWEHRVWSVEHPLPLGVSEQVQPGDTVVLGGTLAVGVAVAHPENSPASNSRACAVTSDASSTRPKRVRIADHSPKEEYRWRLPATPRRDLKAIRSPSVQASWRRNVARRAWVGAFDGSYASASRGHDTVGLMTARGYVPAARTS